MQVTLFVRAGSPSQSKLSHFPELHFCRNWNCIFCKNFPRGNAGARKYAKLYRHNFKFVTVQSETYRWFGIAGGMWNIVHQDLSREFLIYLATCRSPLDRRCCHPCRAKTELKDSIFAKMRQFSWMRVSPSPLSIKIQIQIQIQILTWRSTCGREGPHMCGSARTPCATACPAQSRETWRWWLSYESFDRKVFWKHSQEEPGDEDFFLMFHQQTDC